MRTWYIQNLEHDKEPHHARRHFLPKKRAPFCNVDTLSSQVFSKSLLCGTYFIWDCRKIDADLEQFKMHFQRDLILRSKQTTILRYFSSLQTCNRSLPRKLEHWADWKDAKIQGLCRCLVGKETAKILITGDYPVTRHTAWEKIFSCCRLLFRNVERPLITMNKNPWETSEYGAKLKQRYYFLSSKWF